MHDQIYEESDGTTWYDYFLSLGKSALEQYAKFAEMAIKENMQLDNEDIQGIDEYIANIETAAAENSMTFEEYMSDYMGEGMTKERIRKAVELSRLGYKYYLKIYDGIEVSEEDIESEFSSNIGSYALVDYYEAYIKAEYDETNTEEEITAAKAAAAELAENFRKLVVEDGKSFVDAYNTILPPAEGDAVLEESDLIVTGAANASTLEKLAFMFGEDVKQGDVNLYTDDNGNVYVIHCVKTLSFYYAYDQEKNLHLQSKHIFHYYHIFLEVQILHNHHLFQPHF